MGKNNNTNNILEYERSQRLKDITIIALLLIVPLVIFYTGGTKNVFVHFMYIPVVLAAIDSKQIKVLIVAVVAGLLVGPFMPVDVISGQMQPTQGWLVRMLIFLFVGETVYLFYRRSNKEITSIKLVLKSIQEGVCVIDNNDKIVFINEMFYSIHSDTTKRIIGMNIYQFLRNNYIEIIDLILTITL